MGYRTVETTKTNNVYADIVFRFSTLEEAKNRLWYFMWNSSANEDVQYAACTILDDMNAVYKSEVYEKPIVLTEVPTPTPETE